MFEINATVLKNAKTYLPMSEKIKIAGEIAANCIAHIGYTLQVGAVPLEVPDWCGRNAPLYQRYLLGALLKCYLGIPFEPVEGSYCLLSLDDYDRAAAQHPRNALERCKGDKETRDAAYDLLADYKALCDLAKIAVDDTISARNDPVARYLAAQAMVMTPEALNSISDAENALRGKLDELKNMSADAAETIREKGKHIKDKTQKTEG